MSGATKIQFSQPERPHVLPMWTGYVFLAVVLLIALGLVSQGVSEFRNGRRNGHPVSFIGAAFFFVGGSALLVWVGRLIVRLVWEGLLSPESQIARQLVKGDHTRAVQSLRDFIERRGRTASRINLLGMFEMKEKHFEAASELFREAVDRDASQAHYKNTLGTALLELGRHDEANLIFQDLVQQFPFDLLFLMNHVHTLIKTRQQDEARAMLHRAEIEFSKRRDLSAERRRIVEKDLHECHELIGEMDGTASAARPGAEPEDPASPGN